MSKIASTDSARKTAGTLTLALDALEKFPWLHLFPVEFNNKAQPLLRDYLKRASNDPAQIRRWHAYWKKQLNGRDCWWGVAPALSGLVLADIDTKVGKRGQETFEMFEMLYGWPPTLVTGSPSGGRHHWYRGKHLFAVGSDKSNHPGIDFAQYVILPGCTKKDGSGYTWREDRPIADAPEWFYDEAKRSAAKSVATDAEAAIDELDKPEMIRWAIDFLQNDAEPSIEGQGGEQQTLKVAMSLRDNGISEPQAVELMNDYYNVPGLCEPEWQIEDLTKKIANAYAYANLSRAGGKTAEADFADDDAEEIAASIKAGASDPKNRIPRGSSPEDFYCHLPTNTFIYKATFDMWPASSINGRFGKGAASKLQRNRGVEQATWAPGLPPLIRDKLISNGAWVSEPGASCFNLYRPPTIKGGDKSKAGPWRDHLKKVFPLDWEHIEKWFAYRVQHADIKINHCIVMGGDPGTGKDTLIAGVREAIGPWNFQECNPPQLFEAFDASFLQSVILRINEARDMGESKVDRYQFYERTKTLMASPPETLTVMEKYLKRYAIMNLVCPIITTNNKTNGLYLPADDRRHYVAWSPLTEANFEPGYFKKLWQWYEMENGFAHVAAYLRSKDVTAFDPKATPLKTAAFWEIVGANRAPEDSELGALIAIMGDPACFAGS